MLRRLPVYGTSRHFAATQQPTAISQELLDHLVGKCQKRWRKFNAERLCGL
jgi:hypothetical protein